jgi:hypothetical protein
MTVRSSVRMLSCLTAASAFILIPAGIIPATAAHAAAVPASHPLPHVVLSPDMPGVAHNPDGSWTIPLPAPPTAHGGGQRAAASG